MNKAINTPAKQAPLSEEEMTAAAGRFFPLFEIILKRMPKGSSTEDALKVAESVAKIAHQMRDERIIKEREERFGFVKTEETKEDPK